MLDMHINNVFKVASPTTPPTTGWNATRSLCNIFDQLATTYRKPTPDTMRPKQPHVLGCIQYARLPQDPVKAMYQLPGDCNHGTKPIHNQTAPPKCPAPHCRMRPVLARY